MDFDRGECFTLLERHVNISLHNLISRNYFLRVFFLPCSDFVDSYEIYCASLHSPDKCLLFE